ncbi:hypothetical protein F0562_018997 [Nyssa sinensis]|uniref:Uncharacterized protein n=1 Tax=Nyssa sinensis TaxID=561372 RepID=A0A5J4ZC82_9ASTE|nr:hypothetical protein F0562_018997 [Nyssa sinensis]
MRRLKSLLCLLRHRHLFDLWRHQFPSPPPHRHLFDLRHRNGCDVGGCVVGHEWFSILMWSIMVVASVVRGQVVASVVSSGIGDGDGAGNGYDVGGCVVVTLTREWPRSTVVVERPWVASRCCSG